MLYSRLRQLTRESGLAGCTYVEPYAGGAGAGLSLLLSGQVERLVVNDLDPAVYAFWKMLVAYPDELVSRIWSVPLTVDEWRRQKAIYSSAGIEDVLSLGFATFYLNRTNRSGVLNAGPIGGLGQTGPYPIDARFDRAKLAERVRVASLYAANITVSCMDGAEVIAEYSSHEDTFIYADPPYFQKAGSLYMNTFAIADHERLAAILNSVPRAPWLLTYDSVPDVERLYPDRRRRFFELRYSANGARQGQEIAVLSDVVADFEDGWPLSMTA